MSIITLLFAQAAFAEDCRPQPERLLTDALLESMPEDDAAARADVARDAVEASPGVGELLLSEMAGWTYLEARQASDRAGWGAARADYNNRGFGYSMAAEGKVEAKSGTYRTGGGVFTSPLLLDLDQDGAPGVAGGDWRAHEGAAGDVTALFDIDGDGALDHTEWLDSKDGLLFAPEDASVLERGGALTGRDLFGTATGWPDGFAQLIDQFDKDGDGAVADSELSDLYVWQDTDGDGSLLSSEWSSLSTLGIVSLTPPADGECVGAVIWKDGTTAPIWDWWPSYAPAWRELGEGEAAPTGSLTLSLSDYSAATGGEPLASPDGDLGADALEAAGLHLPSARLLGLSPDGAWLVLTDHPADPVVLHEGAPAARLWLFDTFDLLAGEAAPAIAPLPATGMDQFTFLGDGAALSAHDGGHHLLHIDLAAGEVSSLTQYTEGAEGFRAGDYALRADGGAILSGAFYNGKGGSGGQVLAALTEIRDDGWTLSSEVDLDAARADAGARGTVGGELPAADGQIYFVVRDGAGDAALLAWQDGAMSEVAQDVSLAGAAASGGQVLYFTADGAARLSDGGTERDLGGSGLGYPYLLDDGGLALAAEIDWASGETILWGGRVSQLVMRSLWTLPGPGAVRAADDGSAVAAFGAFGLMVREIAPLLDAAAPQDTGEPDSGADTDAPADTDEPLDTGEPADTEGPGETGSDDKPEGGATGRCASAPAGAGWLIGALLLGARRRRGRGDAG